MIPGLQDALNERARLAIQSGYLPAPENSRYLERGNSPSQGPVAFGRPMNDGTRPVMTPQRQVLWTPQAQLQALAPQSGYQKTDRREMAPDDLDQFAGVRNPNIPVGRGPAFIYGDSFGDVANREQSRYFADLEENMRQRQMAENQLNSAREYALGTRGSRRSDRQVVSQDQNADRDYQLGQMTFDRNALADDRNYQLNSANLNQRAALAEAEASQRNRQAAENQMAGERDYALRARSLDQSGRLAAAELAQREREITARYGQQAYDEATQAIGQGLIRTPEQLRQMFPAIGGQQRTRLEGYQGAFDAQRAQEAQYAQNMAANMNAQLQAMRESNGGEDFNLSAQLAAMFRSPEAAKYVTYDPATKQIVPAQREPPAPARTTGSAPNMPAQPSQPLPQPVQNLSMDDFFRVFGTQNYTPDRSRTPPPARPQYQDREVKFYNGKYYEYHAESGEWWEIDPNRR